MTLGPSLKPRMTHEQPATALCGLGIGTGQGINHSHCGEVRGQLVADDEKTLEQLLKLVLGCLPEMVDQGGTQGVLLVGSARDPDASFPEHHGSYIRQLCRPLTEG